MEVAIRHNWPFYSLEFRKPILANRLHLANVQIIELGVTLKSICSQFSLAL